MALRLNRRQFLMGTATGIALAPACRATPLKPDAHATVEGLASSSYGLDFTFSPAELIGDLEHGERGDPRRQSSVPHHEWYAAWVRHRFGAWGPPARSYAPLAELADRPVEWQRQRVIATAARFIGYDYQHHHIPDWDPPTNWPWKACCAGRNGRGFDCSNFTSFVYNQGFGIRISSAIGRQAESPTATTGGRHLTVRRVELPREYAARRDVLHTGDLLYIRGHEGGRVTHVVLWVGSIGRGAWHSPLVIDSHGPGVRDDEGRPIPCGVHLRPFREDSWYNRCASHAHRILYQPS